MKKKAKVTSVYIEEIIKNNLCDKNLTPMFVSELAKCNIDTAENLIYMKYGITLKKYILNKRLKRAVIMIADGKTAKDACRCCGFGHVKSFYRIFKQKFDVTTTEFRTEFLENPNVLYDYLKDL